MTVSAGSKRDIVGTEARLAGYASGNFGKNILWAFADITLLFVLTDYLHMASGLAGALIAIALLLGAAVDLWVGFAADRPGTSRWRYGRFILKGAPLCAAAFVALYALAELEIRNPIIVGLMLCAFRCSFALIDLPHNALIARVATSSKARGRAAGYRFVFSSIASLLVAMAVPAIAANATGSARALLVLAGGAGLLSMTVMIGCWYLVRDCDTNEGESGAGRGIHVPVDAAFVTLAVIVALTGLSAPLFAKMAIYYSKYVLQSPATAGQLLTALIVGQFAGTILWSWLSQLREKNHILALAHGTAAGAFLLMMLLGPVQPLLLPALATLAGVGLSGIFLMPWALAPDIVDLSEYRSRERHEAATFAVLILLLKLSAGFGTVLAGWTLGAVGYVPDALQGTTVRNWILVLTFGIPAIGAAICAILALRLRMTHHAHLLILRRLDRRRRGASLQSLKTS